MKKAHFEKILYYKAKCLYVRSVVDTTREPLNAGT